MNSQHSITGPSLLYLVRKRLTWRHRQKQVPPELKQALNECESLQQLLEFLFNTDFVTSEVIIEAFDNRIHELEASY